MKRFIALDMKTMSANGLSISDWILLENVHFLSNNKKHQCYANRQTLAEYLGISLSTLKRSIKKLSESGLLTVHSSHNLSVTEKWSHLASTSAGQNEPSGGQNEPSPTGQNEPPHIKEENTKEKKEQKETISRIISYLNSKTEKHFNSQSASTVKSINARFSEGYKLADFQKVIDVKVAEWKDTDMAKYLQPSTLFGNKFDQYLNQWVPVTVPNASNPLAGFKT